MNNIDERKQGAADDMNVNEIHNKIPQQKNAKKKKLDQYVNI